jgi:phage baseplate assembly protein V
VQLVQAHGVAGEVLQAAELMQHYGFTSNPPAGSVCVVLPLGGKTSHGVVVATEHASRIKSLKPGECGIYDDLGQSIQLTRDGIVVDGGGKPIRFINTPSITFDTPQINATGNVGVAQNITAQGNIFDQGSKSMAGMRMIYNGHVHADPATGNTSPPNQSM